MQVPELDLSAFTDMPFPVASQRGLRKKGIVGLEAMGRKLVVLWNEGRPRLFEDACPHLGLPLSYGAVDGKAVRCRYHGWAFAAEDGKVVDQPTLRKPHNCALKQYGALLAGDLVFGWIGAQDLEPEVRRRLPDPVMTGMSLYRLEFACPFYMALFSSVDYAHFPFHTGYRPLYALYSKFRSNNHLPGTSFPSKVVAEEPHRVTVRIDEADRDIHLYATATEMDDKGVNFFQTFVTPISPMRTLYWECYRPRSKNPLVNAAARASFRVVTTRLLSGEDRVWTGASAPNFVRGDNIHLSENDVPLGAHLRKFVLPPLASLDG